MATYRVQRAQVTFEETLIEASGTFDAFGVASDDLDDNTHVMRIFDEDGDVVWERQGLVVLPNNSKGVIK
jgi:hypothetical protein